VVEDASILQFCAQSTASDPPSSYVPLPSSLPRKAEEDVASVRYELPPEGRDEAARVRQGRPRRGHACCGGCTPRRRRGCRMGSHVLGARPPSSPRASHLPGVRWRSPLGTATFPSSATLCGPGTSRSRSSLKAREMRSAYGSGLPCPSHLCKFIHLNAALHVMHYAPM
jgi:hypothetical protein